MLLSLALFWEAYVTIAAAAIALLLALSRVRACRSFARRALAGIVGSVPGVLLAQLLSVPLLAVLYAVLWLASRLMGPLEGSAQIAWNLAVIATFLAIPLILSLLGFLLGWRSGVRLAAGATLREALAASPALAVCARRVSPLRTWLENANRGAS